MELKAGYKQTEVGVIPIDWQIKRLKELSPSQSVGLVINPSSYYDKNGTVPFLVGSNVGENHIDWESAKRITDASNQMLSASRLRAGDLVTVRVGEPGITAVIPPELDGCNCASMMIVKQHPRFDSHWLCYVMNSRIGRQQIESVQYGTAQKQFNISDAVDFLYPVPPLHEQQAIAAALSDVDAMIRALDELIAKKRGIKQGAMQELLTGKKRLVGFVGEWETKRLGELGNIVSGGTPSTNVGEYWDGEIAWCTPTDITRLDGKKYLRETERKITDSGLANSAAQLIPENSIVVTTRATIGECAINKIPLATNQGFKSIVPNEEVDAEFLYYKLLTMKDEIRAKGSGSTFFEVSKTDFVRFSFAIPSSKTEQYAIAELLSDMDAEIERLEQQREKTTALKQGMMQELLTGKTRLM